VGFALDLRVRNHRCKTLKALLGKARDYLEALVGQGVEVEAHHLLAALAFGLVGRRALAAVGVEAVEVALVGQGVEVARHGRPLRPGGRAFQRHGMGHGDDGEVNRGAWAGLGIRR